VVTLPYSGTDASSTSLQVSNTAANGTALSGLTTGSGSGNGVVGRSQGSTSSYGVWGTSDAGFGVVGETTSGGAGVSGTNSNVNGNGVEGYVDGDNATGVYGYNNTGTGIEGFSGGGAGVYGQSPHSRGVYGYSPTGVAGVYGQSITGWAVLANGNLSVTGTKNFVEPHPTDASKEIRYVALEGPEAGTYFRGSARLVGGRATIAIPDHFKMVTADEGLTVQLTPVGQPSALYCVTKSLQGIEVAGNSDVAFDYQVNGVRRAFADFQPIHANTVFVPESAAQMEAFVAALPPESVRRLVANGTLNADHSVNAQTAHRLGWDQRAGWNAMSRESAPARLPSRRIQPATPGQ